MNRLRRENINVENSRLGKWKVDGSRGCSESRTLKVPSPEAVWKGVTYLNLLIRELHPVEPEDSHLRREWRKNRRGRRRMNEFRGCLIFSKATI